VDGQGRFTLDVTSCVRRSKKRVAVIEALCNGNVLDTVQRNVEGLLDRLGVTGPLL
jgi:hypothetical protein